MFWPLNVSSTLLPSWMLSWCVSITTGSPNGRLEPGKLRHSHGPAQKSARQYQDMAVKGCVHLLMQLHEDHAVQRAAPVYHTCACVCMHKHGERFSFRASTYCQSYDGQRTCSLLLASPHVVHNAVVNISVHKPCEWAECTTAEQLHITRIALGALVLVGGRRHQCFSCHLVLHSQIHNGTPMWKDVARGIAADTVCSGR